MPHKDRLVAGFLGSLSAFLIGGLLSCGDRVSGDPAVERSDLGDTTVVENRAPVRADTAEARQRTEPILIRGGRVVRRGTPHERLDLLLERRGGNLLLSAAAGPGQLQGGDTLDIEGLFIHSANPFEATVDTTPSPGPDFRSIAMLVVRMGAGPGTPAKWRIGPSGIRPVQPTENHPAGPVDARAGCYALERGDWSDPDFDWDPQRTSLWFPDSLQLHWQLHWSYGPGPFLVATDIYGQITGERITGFGWWPVADDSLRVSFGDGFAGTTFRGGAEVGGYGGELTVGFDYGYIVRAPARLRRLECPQPGSGTHALRGRRLP